MTPQRHERSTMTGLLLLVVLSAQVERPAVAGAVGSGVPEPDRVAIFKAAGAEPRKGKWVICDPPADVGAPASEAMIEQVTDLNGDGRPEAIVVDGGTYCYGHAGAAFILLSKQADGGWRVITRQNGMLAVLKTKGAGGWPDIAIGGPGFCFPVHRWNGKGYALNRFEYEGKRCKPPR